MKTIENIVQIMRSAAQAAWDYRLDWTVAIWAKAFIRGMAEAVYSVQLVLENFKNQLFPQTANGEFLDLWGEWEGLAKKSGQRSAGVINITSAAADVGTVVPFGTLLQSSAGDIYETTEDAIIIEQVATVTNFFVYDGVAIVTTSLAHGYATGQSPKLVIDGTTIEPETIVVVSETVFRFDTDETGTGLIGTSTDYFVSVNCQSQDVGSEKNLDAGDSLTIIDATDADDEAHVKTAIDGGEDAESVEDYRERILLARRTIRGVFSSDQIKSAGLSVEGNDDIIVDPAEIGPEETPKVAGFQPRPGEVVVYVVRRDSDNRVVDPGDVSVDVIDATKEAIITNGKLPANTAVDDLHVFAVLKNEIDLQINISPDTATMREAVENAAFAFFEDNVEFDEAQSVDKLKSYLSNAYDFTTGTPIDSFTLVEYSDMSGEDKHLMTLGTISCA